MLTLVLVERDACVVAVKHKVIGAGLAALHVAGLHRLAAPWTRGLGAILTFHRVSRPVGDGFAPNQGLEVTPEFLDALLAHASRRGYRLVPLEAVPDLLRGGHADRPFLALTFDDGYRDTVEAALPVLERHAAPFTVFATTGFLDRTARLWWIELELALRQLQHTRFRARTLTTVTPRQKLQAFQAIVATLLAGDDERLLTDVADIAGQAGLSPDRIVDDLCLGWDGLKALARHPLARIGCHTLTHPRLARLPQPDLRAEMAASRDRLEHELQRRVTTFCYPYGMRSAAGPREFAMAAELGYRCAVTTRPDVLTARHAAHPTGLPRISVNGLYQTLGAADVLLSGAGFAIWNGIERWKARGETQARARGST